MSNFITISWRIFLFGFQNFVRNAWLSLAAVSVIAISLISILSIIIVYKTSDNVISQISENLKISIYIDNEVDDSDLSDFKAVLTAQEAVADIRTVAPQEAYEQFVANYREDIDISEAIDLTGPGGDFFPLTLEVSVSELDQISNIGAIADRGEYAGFIESVSLGKTDSQATIQRASEIQNFLIRTNIVLALVFGAVSCLIILSTIRMAIFSRRDEIQIMRFVGASRSFIRNPFLIEAGLYGLVGGILAIVAIYGLLILFGERLESMVELASSYQYFAQNANVIVFMSAISIAGGILIGISTSAIALQRYLKE